MSLIEDFFYALDTPGAYARGALSGRLGRRASGEDVLRSWGAKDPNKWAGIAAEMVLDPINLIPGGLGLKALRGAKAATAANKATRIMIKKGAMPRRLAAETSVMDKAGKPMAVYHGTQFPFEKVDLSKSDPASLYGPGFYTTKSPRVASGYAERKSFMPGMGKGHHRAPHVRKAFMHSKKMFDVDANVTPDDLKRIAKAAIPITKRESLGDISGELKKLWAWDAEGRPLVKKGRPSDIYGPPMPTKKQLYNDLVNLIEQWGTADDAIDVSGEARAIVNEILRAAGFDSIKHVGGALTGGAAHNVHIGLLGESQMFKPWIAPALQQVPNVGRQIGLLATGAGGYQGAKIGLRPRRELQIGIAG